MTIWEAIVLGIVQGLTEFLPISSTAHLRLVPALFDKQDYGAAFTAVVQLGTLIAVFYYFRADVVRLGKAFLADFTRFRFGSTPDSKLAWMIAVGTVPIVVLGLTFKKQISGEFRNLYAVALAMLGFAILLLIAEVRAKRQQKQGNQPRDVSQITWRDTLIIGLFQALALIPGASRSGVTITAGLFVGLSRDTAARFSFLLSLPSILGAGLYEFYKERHELLQSQEDILNLTIATVLSGIVGYLSIAFLLGYLKNHSTYLFIIYRLLLGTTLLLLLQQGILNPQ